MPQSVFSWCFLSVSKLFQHCSTSGPRTGFLSREPDFQKILKKPQNMFSQCFLSFKVFLALFDIWTGCLSREPDFHKFLEKPQNMFSWCFLSVSMYFSIVRNLSREPDFSAENRSFKNFSKSLKTYLAGVFWVFHGILALVDIWAENRIFQPRIGFSKNS